MDRMPDLEMADKNLKEAIRDFLKTERAKGMPHGQYSFLVLVLDIDTPLSNYHHDRARAILDDAKRGVK